MRPLRLLRAATSLVAPPRCGICSRGCPWHEPVCGPCTDALGRLRTLRRALPGFGSVRGGGPYDGVARDLVTALKFGPRPALAPVAATVLARAAGPPPRDAAVVPVPPAPQRLRRRGFDPADAIAAALARELGLPLARCLARARGPRQVGRSRSDRLAGPPEVSCVDPPPRRVLLVDDVLTTGATLAACARALRGAGAEAVDALVVAIAVPGGRGTPPVRTA